MFRWPRTINLRVVAWRVIALLLFLFSAPLWAQVTSGTITGQVQDASGAVISGASVTISNPSNGLTRTVTTSENGEFVAPNILPGPYNITVELKGFKRLQTQGFVRTAADKLSAGVLVLAVGAATDEVT